MTIFGWLLILLAQLFLGFRLYGSYESRGGKDGKTLILDGVFLPPFLGVVGLHVTHKGSGTTWPAAAYLALWCAQTVFCFAAITLAGMYKDRKSSRATK